MNLAKSFWSGVDTTRYGCQETYCQGTRLGKSCLKNWSFKQTFKKYSKLKPFNSSHQPVPKLSEQWQRGFQGQFVFQVLSLKASQRVLQNHNKSIFRTKTQIGAKLDSWNFIKSTLCQKLQFFCAGVFEKKIEKKICLNSILKIKSVSRKKSGLLTFVVWWLMAKIKPGRKREGKKLWSNDEK